VRSCRASSRPNTSTGGGAAASNVRWALNEWAAWLRSLDSISRRGLAVAVLSHCRILHTLATGVVSSKRVAGEWALRELDAEWASFIRRSLDYRVAITPDCGLRDKTLARASNAGAQTFADSCGSDPPQ
jgi:Domain of unknown function (DUF4111)